MFLETYDIGESFAKRVTIIREVNLVKPNTSCSKLSLGKTVNLHTEISMQYKKLTIMDSLSFKLVFCCMNDASFFTSSELLKILKKNQPHSESCLCEPKLSSEPYVKDKNNDTISAVLSSSRNFLHQIPCDDAMSWSC